MVSFSGLGVHCTGADLFQVRLGRVLAARSTHRIDLGLSGQMLLRSRHD